MPATFRSDSSFGRLEAFSDGVIAVIITIMVLELKVPQAPGLDGLRSVLPMLGIYALSFTFIGIYWVNHHGLVGRAERCNNRILWCNLIWLFCLSLIPFFTAYVAEHAADAFSVRVYSGCMLLAGASFLLLRYAIDCQAGNEGRLAPLAVATRLKHWGSLALYAFAVAIAGFAPHLALAATACVTLIWIVPTLGLFGEQGA